MSDFAAVIAELEAEAAITGRVLARIPDEHLSWKPHDKSMTLGQLAMHIAQIPGNIAAMLEVDHFEVKPERLASGPAVAQNSQELMAAHQQSIEKAKQFLAHLTAEKAAQTWKMSAMGKTLIEMPRGAAVRTVMLNHWYHHRGQATVYLRLLNVPVPIVYGRSADENPFEAASA